ncbi:MAG: 50S ribosomal protein L4 [Thermoproteota archaeon]
MSADLVPVFDKDGKTIREVSISPIFKFDIRQRLIQRAYVITSRAWYQPKGRDPMAGKRTSAKSWGVDRGLSRVPRLSSGRARFAPSVVKGRLAHPPISTKKLHKKINKKERLRAILSAISATANQELVRSRGHRIDQLRLPIILDSEVKKLSRTSEVRGMLENFGLSEELKRVEDFRERSGASARRGRRVKRKVGPLIVVDEICPLQKASSNIPGVEVINARRLGIRELVPGGQPGRLTLWLEPAIQVLERRLIKTNAE